MMFLKIYSLIIYSVLMISALIGIGKEVQGDLEKFIATIVGIVIYVPIFVYLVLA